MIVRGDEIVARGRNRICEAHEINGFIGGTQISHAELNALVQPPNDADTRDLELYSTMEPYPMCAGAIRVSHVPTTFYAARALGEAASKCFNCIRT